MPGFNKSNIMLNLTSLYLLHRNRGKLWQPTKNSKICSQHFIGNEKSGHPLNPSYVPTLFPDIYKSVKNEHSVKRFKRYLKRIQTNESDHCHSEITDEIEVDNTVKMINFSSQVNFDYTGEIFCFESTHYTCDVSTQATIPTNSHPHFRSEHTADKAVGVEAVHPYDCLSCNGFHGFTSINNDDELNSIGGVDFARFFLFLSFLGNSHGNDKLSMQNKLLIFLIKMKCGLSYSAIGVLFGLHRTTISRIFSTILMTLAEKTRKYIYWPRREVVLKSQPEAFKKNYPNCRVIIDCTEIRIEQPSRVDQRIYMYSQYKSTYTVKFLLGVTPHGQVSFLSSCYGGKASDSFITNDSGLLHLLQPGDQVLADKGFPGIKIGFNNENVIIVMPPFLHNGNLSEEEVEETYSVASVRIHVERCIQRVKVYSILQTKLPTELLPYIDDIVHMCCVMANLQPPIFKE